MHSPTSNVQAAKRENDLLFPIFANIQGGFDRNGIRMKQSGTVGGELYSRDSHVTDIPFGSVHNNLELCQPSTSSATIRHQRIIYSTAVTSTLLYWN